ncbi:hypothetical protein K8T06_09590 [bacterium]|nr:hypothetical protein [bacterium]
MHLSDISRQEFGGFVSNLLQKNGINVILSGGSCVSIYTMEAYVSGDLDFIRTGLDSMRSIRSILMDAGFAEVNRYFKHPESDFFVEFPGGPPSVGEDPIVEFNLIETEYGMLKLLTPTDCIKDRLAAYFHWDDEDSLHNAILVAKSNLFDLDEIERWSCREGKSKVFVKIRNLFKI